MLTSPFEMRARAGTYGASPPAHSLLPRSGRMVFRRQLAPLSLALLATALLGCPPPKAPPLPKEEPGKSEPAARTSPEFDTTAPIDTEIMNQGRDKVLENAKNGVITAFPNIRVFVKEKRIEVDGLTAMKTGPQLELLACAKNGKAYESLLVWDILPTHLQIALLAIGLEPKAQVKRFGQRKALREGQRVVIEVEWKDPKTQKPVRRRAEDLLYDVSRDGCMKHAGWVFTGSMLLDWPQPPDGKTTKTIFTATETGTIAVTYHDPDAILDTPLREGGDNTLFVAWADRLPERWTPIVAHIRPWRAGDDLEPPDARRPSGQERPVGGAPGPPRPRDDSEDEPDDPADLPKPPAETKPGETKPGDKESDEKPGEVKPGEPKPGDEKPGEGKPGEAPR